MMISQKILAAVATIVPCVLIAQEPGTIPWTPKDKGDLQSVSIVVPPQYSAIGLNPTSNRLSIPRGWTASVFFAGSVLNKPRFMSWGPDSVLYVANMSGGNILALPDLNHDGIADTSIIAARGFSGGHDVRFLLDTMFVSTEAGLLKLWRSDQSTYTYDQRVTLIDKNAQSNQTGGNHRTRTLVIDTIRQKFYINVGSRGNADRESDRAVIEEYDMDGSGRRIFASGVRNSVGMTLHPRTGKLWANNNGSDNQGNDVPPEWVDIVRDGGFYGYPFSYHFKRWYSFVGDYSDLLPITRQDSSRVNSTVAPAALVAAHCAPMALVFTENNARPEHTSGAFMAMRGSWNRVPPSGAKVVFLAFDNDEDTIANVVRDFCTGFITDTNNINTRWARPVGLAVASDGSVYVSSDETKQFILKLTPPVTSSVEEGSKSDIDLHPIPAQTSLVCTLPSLGGMMRCYDTRGVLVYEAVVQPNIVNLDVSTWAQGSYAMTITDTSGAVNTQSFIIYR